MIEAAEIIRSTYTGWSAADVAAFQAMLVHPGYARSAVPASVSASNGTFYWRIYNGDPGRHGNQDLIAWRAMLVMGVFLDNRVMFDRALRYFKGEAHRADDLPYPSGPSLSGAQIDDNDYFTSYQPTVQSTTPDYGYNGVLAHYVWENGQCQEASRDQQHTFFGLGIAAGIAEVAWNQGDGVWNALDNRLLKGFEFTARYNASYIATFPDQQAPWEPTGSAFIVRTDRTGRWRSKAINPHFESDFVGVSRGDFPGKRPVFEQPLAHFRVRMGRPDSETLWTARARDVAVAMAGQEPIGFSLDHPGFGGLTFARPPLGAGDPITGFGADGLPVFGVHVAARHDPRRRLRPLPDRRRGPHVPRRQRRQRGRAVPRRRRRHRVQLRRPPRAHRPGAGRVGHVHGARARRRQPQHRRPLRGHCKRRRALRVRRHRRHRRRRAAGDRRRLAHADRRGQRRAARRRAGDARHFRRQRGRLRRRLNRRRARSVDAGAVRSAP